jgi:hypothetical protein
MKGIGAAMNAFTLDDVQGRSLGGRRRREPRSFGRSDEGKRKYLSPSTKMLLTSVALATATTVIVFGAPPLSAGAGGSCAGLPLFVADRIEHLLSGR